MERLNWGIANLPEHFAAPFLMHEIGGLSYKQIADLESGGSGRVYEARDPVLDLIDALHTD
ncbi:MAG: hypothetical protein K8F91_05355 [Candidatus Obscuribacterales bacterium]|nr:hypothetical protein [Candidatus Obscuribacterales bacterium]